jgi:dTDP-4-amino-4,6-dideoxygalactose transaminase
VEQRVVFAVDNVGARIACIQPQVASDPWLETALKSILRSGRLSNHGPHAVALEQSLSAWLGQETLAVSSGAMALELGLEAMRSLPVKVAQRAGAEKRTVVLPACTYVATLNAVQRMGYEPVFCDIDSRTWTLCPDALREILRQRDDVAVVLPVNVYGVPPDLLRIRAVADTVGARVLYDCAHGMGTRVAGERQPLGAHATAWSMHATKLLPAGEGGLLSSPDARIVAAVRQLRNHGIDGDPVATVVGTNAKLSELHAAVARASFRRIEAILAQRQGHMQRLRALLQQIAPQRLRLQAISPDVESNAQNLTVLVTDDDGTPSPQLATRWIAALERLDVEARRYFWPPLHQLHRLKQPQAALPVTDAVMPALVCLPLHTQMPEPVIDRLQGALSHSLKWLH